MFERIIGSNGLWCSEDGDQRAVWIEFFRTAVPLMIILAVVFFGIHFFHYAYTRNIIDVREHSYIKIGYEAIRNDIRVATSDLMHLAASKHMQDLLAKPSNETKNHLNSEFESILNTKRLYDQIRYLNETGMEIVRVNFNSGMPLAVPEAKLQNKASRYYFKDSFKLKPGTVYVSPMDLNIESGRIERPLKPMLRFGTPVFDHNNRKRGVLIINYFADNILKNIEQYLDNPNSDTMLLNAQGYWMLAPEKNDEWGFMFNNQRKLANQYPEVWQEIIRRKNGQIESEGGLFTFITIYPLSEEHASGGAEREAQAQSIGPVDDQRYFWVLVTHVPRSRLSSEITSHVKQGAVQLALVSMVILPVALLFGRERAHRKSVKRALRNHERYLDVVTSQLAEGLLVVDQRGRVTSLNREAERLIGWTSEELAGTGLEVVLPTFPPDAVETNEGCVVVKAIKKGVSQRVAHVVFSTKEGDSLPVSFSVAPFRYEETISGAIITFRDISEQLKMENELKRMATHDPLTGIKNRGEIERLLAVDFNRAKRYCRPLVVMMIDIDHFKKINDTFGHQRGDVVLQAACSQMNKLLRSTDALGRYGGEEFLVILPETTLSAATTVAQRLCDSIGALVVSIADMGDIRFTVSIGLAAYPDSAKNGEQLVQIADAMLYRAKELGRNRVVNGGGLVHHQKSGLMV